MKTHRCGYPIRLNSAWNSLAYYTTFIDDNEESPTCGQEISNCPRCGEALLHSDDLVRARAKPDSSELDRLRRVLTAARRALPNLKPLIEWKEEGIYQCRFCSAIGRRGSIKHKDCAAEELVTAIKAMTK